jgi:hypothetical protein
MYVYNDFSPNNWKFEPAAYEKAICKTVVNAQGMNESKMNLDVTRDYLCFWVESGTRRSQ